MSIADAIRAERLRLVSELEIVSAEARLDMIERAAIETGGTFIPPSRNSWGPHDFTISLLGVSQSAETAEAAIRLWMKTVLRMERQLQEDETREAAA